MDCIIHVLIHTYNSHLNFDLTRAGYSNYLYIYVAIPTTKVVSSSDMSRHLFDSSKIIINKVPDGCSYRGAHHSHEGHNRYKQLQNTPAAMKYVFDSFLSPLTAFCYNGTYS